MNIQGKNINDMYTRFEFHVKEKTARKTISKRLQDWRFGRDSNPRPHA